MPRRRSRHSLFLIALYLLSQLAFGPPRLEASSNGCTPLAFKKIAAGADHTAAVSNVTATAVFTWGENADGQLGDGTTVDRRHPTLVDLGVTVTAVAAGRAHTLVLLSDGTVWAWGANNHGQLATTTASSSAPIKVLGLPPTVSAIAAGGDHSLAIASGRLYGWGANSDGQVGNGTTTDAYTPQLLAPSATFSKIEAGTSHSLAIKADKLFTWGDNSHGQLGNGQAADVSVPTEVSTLTGIKEISGGDRHSLARTGTQPSVWAWGDNNHGQLGRPNLSGSNVPVTVPLGPNVNTQFVAAGRDHSIALTFAGFSWTWGSNGYGQLGRQTSGDSSIPGEPTYQRIAGEPTSQSYGAVDLRYTLAVAAGGGHSIFLDHSSARYVYSSGKNESGQLGDGSRFTRNPLILGGCATSGTPAVPDTPSSVTATAGDGLALVRWAPGSDGGNRVTRVKVTASPGGKVVVINCSVSHALVTGLENGVSYTFSVEATNDVGSSGVGTSTGVTPATSSVTGFYTSGNVIKRGLASSPSTSDPTVILRGVNVEWINYDLRSQPAAVAVPQPNVGPWLGWWPGWPNVSSGCTPLTDESIQAMHDWGVNMVRVNLTPTFWGTDSNDGSARCLPFPGYRENVDEVVSSITARGMLALLDLHNTKRIPCSPTDHSTIREMPDSTGVDFWRSVALRYARNPLVAFDIYNEPHTEYLNEGRSQWQTWLHGGPVRSNVDLLLWTAAGMQEMYSTIRGVETSIPSVQPHLVFLTGNKKGIVLPDPLYFVRDTDGNPARSVVYGVHHYSYLSGPDCLADCLDDGPTGYKAWSETNGIPVVVTEFGWNRPPSYDATYCSGTPCGRIQNTRIICHATDNDMGWVAYRWASDEEVTDTNLNVGQYYAILDGTGYLWELLDFDSNPQGEPVKSALAYDPTTAAGKASISTALGC